jgi:hypothetical protein
LEFKKSVNGVGEGMVHFHELSPRIDWWEFTTVRPFISRKPSSFQPDHPGHSNIGTPLIGRGLACSGSPNNPKQA